MSSHRAMEFIDAKGDLQPALPPAVMNPQNRKNHSYVMTAGQRLRAPLTATSQQTTRGKGPRAGCYLARSSKKAFEVRLTQKDPIANFSSLVYIGETASLSYLQFVRRVVQHRIGPCPFTEGEFNNFMLESNIKTGSPEAPVKLTQNEKMALAQAYLDGVSSICLAA